ncbi:2-oxoglutarate dehydrogenase E2 component (dihydrolipoamide succinyltransferase) [Lentzea waywayandensis]|uniref:Dihydrolipoamide acetyltransferase component of pyruvate dehydrogenase complex n=1 Tax=Lentzea waywayandensis TaxID=84724 RepID=A0A1I6FDS8_9PSEU|nr:2-oxo acid dehydrogenase subunit E2 [Lentzea waywayandensis]SFR28068.1 2-oxoglutarate dehydrogenase E2 component (dihydrolipoamide succinyltransferase) [Lentzea waywayandensis]
MIDVEVPKLNNNDAGYVLTDWLVEEGRWVRPGDPIAVIETSKTAEELISEQGGVLHQVVPESAECQGGDVVGHLFDSEEDHRRFTAELDTGVPAPDEAEVTTGPVLTEPARALAERHGIGLAEFGGLGRAVVRESDVQRLLDERGSTGESDVDVHEPGRVQRAVAAAVTESHRSIPAAFTAIAVPVDAALAEAARRSASGDSWIGLPELLVAVVGALHRDFPICYGHPLADGTVALPRGAHVGVTIDVGKGLKVPVVRDAHQRSVAELADVLMDFRIRAMRDTLRPADLEGGNILVSLNNEEDVLVATPIVMPGQICALSLAGTRQEPVPGADGTPAFRSVVHIGLAYDHRFVNGREAIRFLRAVRAGLETAGSDADAAR